jgi:hypothetical protein
MASEIKIFLSLFFVYLIFVQWYGWNEESNFALTRAISEEKRFEIDSFANQTGDRAFYKEHYYTDKDPGLSFLASVIYVVWNFFYQFFPNDFKAKHAGSDLYVTELQDSVAIITYFDRGFFIFTSMILLTAFTSCLFSSLTSLLIYKISSYFLEKEKERILVSLAFGFGTLLFPYALHFMVHATSMFFLFLSFCILFKLKNEKTESRKLILLAGIFAGFGVVVDKLGILISFLLIFYSFFLRKHSIFFVSGFFLSLLPLLLYNYSNFNNPLEFASSYIDRQIYRTAYPQSVLPIFFSGRNKFVSMSFDFPLIEKLLEHFHFVPASPNLYVMFRLLFCPYRGLFFYSPILFLSIPGFFLMFKKYKTEAILIVSILILFVSIISMRRNWWGGYCFGDRYLLLVVPFLTIPLIFVFKKINRKIFVVFLFISIFINFLGLQPAEEWAYDWKSMDMRLDWLEKQNSFQILANPLLEHYIPLTLKNGPRSGIFEHLINGYISIDIRFPPLSKGVDFPFSKFHIPFLVLVPVFIVEISIWRKEIMRDKR